MKTERRPHVQNSIHWYILTALVYSTAANDSIADQMPLTRKCDYAGRYEISLSVLV